MYQEVHFTIDQLIKIFECMVSIGQARPQGSKYDSFLFWLYHTFSCFQIYFYSNLIDKLNTIRGNLVLRK